MKRIIYILAIFLSTGLSANAQSMFGISYDIGVPLGSTSDYISKPSFRGFGLEGRAFLTDNISYGGSFSWAVFYEEVGPQEWDLTEFEDLSNATAYGTQYRYINSFPFMGTMHYYFGEWDETRLYVGAGMGAQIVNTTTDFGLYSNNDDTWRFCVAPEVGVLIPINFNNSLNLSAKYQYATKSGDSDAASYLTFKIGFAFM